MKFSLPKAFYNRMSVFGGGLAGISFLLIIFLLALESVSAHPKAYTGIFAFMLFPGLMVVGLILFFYGGYRQQKRIRRGDPSTLLFPRLDLNEPRQRRILVLSGIGLFAFLALSAFGSYELYEYSDSDQFCGEVCHIVMSPEYTAYQSSPHARVGCAKCHIGSGADWFVRAKISGSYQVYSVLFKKYARPIATPIENLRPAQQTCEQCHWPSHFFSELRRTNTYYLSDEANSRWTLDLLLKVGGGTPESGPTGGIHWAMNIANEITYATLDPKRQVIPWVQVKDRQGRIRTYRSLDTPLSAAQLQEAEKRRMDCIDCHNRPSHIYHPPARSINHLLSMGAIDPALPWAKSVAMKALDLPYESAESARDSIAIVVREFYRSRYPALASSQATNITRMIEELRAVHARNFFPYMKASWKNYPNNIGHLYDNGCFRCHDGRHVSEDGKVLSKDCNICHTILSQKDSKGQERTSLAGLEYVHPVDVGDSWKTMACKGCHGKRKE